MHLQRHGTSKWAQGAKAQNSRRMSLRHKKVVHAGAVQAAGHQRRACVDNWGRQDGLRVPHRQKRRQRAGGQRQSSGGPSRTRQRPAHAGGAGRTRAGQHFGIQSFQAVHLRVLGQHGHGNTAALRGPARRGARSRSPGPASRSGRSSEPGHLPAAPAGRCGLPG